MLNFSLISTSLISLGLLTVLVFNTNPFESSNFILGTFFIILLVFMFSIISIICIAANKILKKHNSKSLILRRSFLISVLMVGLALFSALKVLNFMSALTYFVALVLTEFFFSSRKVEKESE